jgi:hypothetical protein
MMNAQKPLSSADPHSVIAIPQEKACKWLPLAWNGILFTLLARDLPQHTVAGSNQPYCVVS